MREPVASNDPPPAPGVGISAASTLTMPALLGPLDGRIARFTYDPKRLGRVYAIFERDAVSHWPLCNRKLGLDQQVAAIKSM